MLGKPIVFFSHASEDKKANYVEALLRELLSKLELWIDEPHEISEDPKIRECHRIPYGSNWQDEIEKALTKKTSVVILLYSEFSRKKLLNRNSYQRGRLGWEVKKAYRANRLVWINVDGTPIEDFPNEIKLSKVHGVKLNEYSPGGYSSKISDLIEEIFKRSGYSLSSSSPNRLEQSQYLSLLSMIDRVGPANSSRGFGALKIMRVRRCSEKNRFVRRLKDHELSLARVPDEIIEHFDDNALLFSLRYKKPESLKEQTLKDSLCSVRDFPIYIHDTDPRNASELAIKSILNEFPSVRSSQDPDTNEGKLVAAARNDYKKFRSRLFHFDLADTTKKAAWNREFLLLLKQKLSGLDDIPCFKVVSFLDDGKSTKTKRNGRIKVPMWTANSLCMQDCHPSQVADTQDLQESTLGLVSDADLRNWGEFVRLMYRKDHGLITRLIENRLVNRLAKAYGKNSKNTSLPMKVVTEWINEEVLRDGILSIDELGHSK